MMKRLLVTQPSDESAGMSDAKRPIVTATRAVAELSPA
jgi:hypothetical protein